MTKRPRLISVATQTDVKSTTSVNEENTVVSNGRTKRQRELAEFDRSCPAGWKLDPEAVRYLQSPAYSFMIPGAVPMKYPPRMLPQHVLELLPNLDEMQLPLIDKTIAEELLQQSAAYGNQRELKINVVLLWTGQSMNNVPYRWILLRLFGKSWRYKESSDVVLSNNEEVTVSIKEANLLWPGAACQQLINEASVFVLMVESLMELEDLLGKLVPCLNQGYNENQSIPPFLCFTSFLQESNPRSGDFNGLDSWLKAEEQEEIELCFRKLHLNVGLEVISIKDHLSVIKQHLYRTIFIQKWKISQTDSSGLSDESSALESLVDPFKKVSKFLKRSLSLKSGKSNGIS
eukprot:g2927.t1